MAEGSEIGRQRIVIINESALLAAGLQSLLADQPDLDVITLAPTCPAELIRELEYFRPDMIVLARGHPTTNPPELLGTLGDYPLLRVVAISSECNTVQVYDRAPLKINAIGDLLALIPRPGAATLELARGARPPRKE